MQTQTYSNSSADLERIRNAIDAVQLIGRYLKLKRSGAQFFGLCPFHRERTPSFYVHPTKKLWKCWGCGASGDLFSFVMRLEGVSFARAKEILADAAGIPLANMTDAERRNWHRRMRAARPQAESLVQWKVETLEALRYHRNRFQRTYHGAVRFVLQHTFDECAGRGDLRFEAALAVGETYWNRVVELDEQIDRLETANYADLLNRFQGVA